MDKGNDLRRTKEKLEILENTPNIGWVMTELVSIVLEDQMERFGACYRRPTEIYIKELQTKYKKFIKTNSKKDLKQGEIF